MRPTGTIALDVGLTWSISEAAYAKFLELADLLNEVDNIVRKAIGIYLEFSPKDVPTGPGILATRYLDMKSRGRLQRLEGAMGFVHAVASEAPGNHKPFQGLPHTSYPAHAGKEMS